MCAGWKLSILLHHLAITGVNITSCSGVREKAQHTDVEAVLRRCQLPSLCDKPEGNLWRSWYACHLGEPKLPWHSLPSQPHSLSWRVKLKSTQKRLREERTWGEKPTRVNTRTGEHNCCSANSRGRPRVRNGHSPAQPSSTSKVTWTRKAKGTGRDS